MVKNVLEWLEITCSKMGNKTAFLDINEFITFDSIQKSAMIVGTALASVLSDAPIAVISGRNINTVSAYLGVVYSGHAYAPIDGKLPEHRLNTILSILQPSAILTDADNYETANNLSNGTPVYILEELLKGIIDITLLNKIRNSMVMSDPLYVIFTSGSTGKPKGVITSHQALICYIESYGDMMQINENDILGNQSPLDYIAAIRDIYLPLFKGCSTVIIPKDYFMQPNKLFDFMNKHCVTSVGWSVSAFTIALSLGAFTDVGLSTLRKVCFSGSIMPPSCLSVWQKNLPNTVFVNQYGPTETTASCTYYKIDHIVSPDEQIPIGIPYNNYHVFLVNEDLTYTPQGSVGEICVSGPILALGYYNDQERTNKNFIQNPNNCHYYERMYKTGDYGLMRKDGILEFHGRIDRQIKHMGHRVELDEVDYAASQIEGIDECISIYSKEKETIYLFYSGEKDIKSLFIYLKQNLPVFMVPRKIIKLDNLPKLENSKIDMTKLKEKM